MPTRGRSGVGDLSDRYGRRPILNLSLAGTVVSFVMLAMAHSVVLFPPIVRRLSGGKTSRTRARLRRRRHPERRIGRGPPDRTFGLGFILGRR